MQPEAETLDTSYARAGQRAVRVSRVAPRVATVLVGVALTALSYLSPALIPYCMDEFVHYQPLACAVFPLTREHNVFREECGRYDLVLPFTQERLPLRAYDYIGSLPALVFVPFWRLLHDPVAARVQGALFLMLASWLVARLEGLLTLDALLAAVVFPVYSVAFLADLGPAGLSLVVLALALHALRSACTASGAAARAWLGALTGGLVFLGFWIKPVFSWTLPAIAALGWRWTTPNGAPVRLARPTLARIFGAAALAGGLPLLLLLFARDPEGQRYYTVSANGEIGLHTFLEPAGRMLHYVVNGGDVLPRTLSLPASPMDRVPFLLGCAVLAAAWPVRGRSGTWLLGSLLTLASTATTRSAWGPHHVAYTLFFVVGGLAVALAWLRRTCRRAWLAVLVCAALVWGSLVARLPEASVNFDSNADKDALLSFVREQRLDAHTVVVHATWGTFFIAHLFGARTQCQLYVLRLPDRPDDLREVRALADRLNRGVIVITARQPRVVNTPALENALGRPLAVHEFGRWRAFEFLRRAIP